jgi:hypothetical protein
MQGRPRERLRERLRERRLRELVADDSELPDGELPALEALRRMVPCAPG